MYLTEFWNFQKWFLFYFFQIRKMNNRFYLIDWLIDWYIDRSSFEHTKINKNESSVHNIYPPTYFFHVFCCLLKFQIVYCQYHIMLYFFLKKCLSSWSKRCQCEYRWTPIFVFLFSFVIISMFFFVCWCFCIIMSMFSEIRKF